MPLRSIMAFSTPGASVAFFTISGPSPASPRVLPASIRLPIPKPICRPRIILRSIDVSKEDQQEQPISLQEEEHEAKFDKRRLEEKFAVVNTGVFECRSCGYKYEEAAGDPGYPIPPGMPFDKLPDDWRCPTCGASQTFFQSKKMEIAGFAQNQQFGLGGNSLTSGDKALLIYGSLFLGFLFFLSGYFIQ